MSARNSKTHYGSLAKLFHWLTVLLVLTAIGLGVYGNYGINPETEAGITQLAVVFSLHKTVGITTFIVAVLRILWALNNVKPGLLNADHKMQAMTAEVVHWLLYISLVFVPLSGWIHHAAASGFAPILWPLGQSLPLVPKSEAVSEFFASWHFIFTKVLLISILLHFLGALKHHIIDKDSTLRRMLPGVPTLPTGVYTCHPKGPIVGAFLIYFLAMGAGSYTSLQHRSEGVAVAELTKVSSGWEVQSGSLGITVKQFGSDVEGIFSDWTAEISYDEATQAGDLAVTVSVGSLTLGSVTDNALGTDYLNATMFRTATYTGQISADAKGHIVKGSLNLRGVDAPLNIPFSLTTQNGVATAKGSAAIDRRTHKIGELQATENNLGFSVIVNFDLVAQKAD